MQCCCRLQQAPAEVRQGASKGCLCRCVLPACWLARAAAAACCPPRASGQHAFCARDAPPPSHHMMGSPPTWALASAAPQRRAQLRTPCPAAQRIMAGYRYLYVVQALVSRPRTTGPLQGTAQQQGTAMPGAGGTAAGRYIGQGPVQRPQPSEDVASASAASCAATATALQSFCSSQRAAATTPVIRSLS